MKIKPTLILSAWLLLTGSLSSNTQKAEEIQFQKGGSSARIEGNIKGKESKRYLLRAGKGQFMNASAGSRNGALQLVIFAPGQKPGLDMPLFSSERNGGIFDGELPAAGKYLFEISLLRSATRRGERADFVLEVSISGKPTATKAIKAEDADIAWPSQSDASGKIACSPKEANTLLQCEFRAKYNPYGVTIWVRKPESKKAVRTLYYEKEKFTTGDDRVEIRQSRKSNSWQVNIGDSEQYMIPDSVIHRK